MNNNDSIVLAPSNRQETRDRGLCILDKSPLVNLTEYDPEDEKPEYYILECPTCHKQYYPKYEVVPHSEGFTSIHGDILNTVESEGIDAIFSDTLLVDTNDYRFGKGSTHGLSKAEKHAYKYFGSHVDVVSYEETDPTRD